MLKWIKFNSIIAFFSPLLFLSSAYSADPFAELKSDEGQAILRSHVGSYTGSMADALFGSKDYFEYQLHIRENELEFIAKNKETTRLNLVSSEYKFISLNELNRFLNSLPSDKGVVAKSLAKTLNEMVTKGQLKGQIVVQLDLQNAIGFTAMLFSQDESAPAIVFLLAMDRMGIVTTSSMFGSSKAQNALWLAEIEKLKAGGKTLVPLN